MSVGESDKPEEREIFYRAEYITRLQTKELTTSLIGLYNRRERCYGND